MAGQQIVDGFEGLGAVFLEMDQQLNAADYTKALEPHLQGLEQLHAGYFSGEVDANGEKWAPLAPSTIERKGHSTILVETSALKASLTGSGGAGIREVSHRGLLFGTSDEKALFHQEGTSRMPARPPVGITEAYVDKVSGDVADAAVETLKLKI